MNATTQLETVNVNAEKVMDWAISSQVSQECGKGSTTSARSPVRTVKRHECGAAMYKQVIGIYSISHDEAGIVYYGSSKCVSGRIASHKRELRNGIHKNQFLQNAWNKYGSELKFTIVELCDIGELRVREQFYIDNAKGRLMNMELEVCEIASSATHSRRMRNAWSNRSAFEKKCLADKISNTVKSNYQQDSGLLEKAQNALVKARKVLKDSGYYESGIAKAHAAAKEMMTKKWSDPKWKAKTSSNISKGMQRIEHKCQHCDATFIGSIQAKYCNPVCRMGAYYKRHGLTAC